LGPIHGGIVKPSACGPNQAGGPETPGFAGLFHGAVGARGIAKPAAAGALLDRSKCTRVLRSADLLNRMGRYIVLHARQLVEQTGSKVASGGNRWNQGDKKSSGFHAAIMLSAAPRINRTS